MRKADYLFLGIIGVLYPDMKKQYMENSRAPRIKERILKQFQDDGYFLLDLYELPISFNKKSKDEVISNLLKKVNNLELNNSPIILIKANVYDIAYGPLKRHFNVINKRIEFPSCGNQQKFYEKFSEVKKCISRSTETKT